MLYITKHEALCTGISIALKNQEEISVMDVISVDVKKYFKETGNVCHSDELEHCTDGVFEAQVRCVIELDGIFVEKPEKVTGQYKSIYKLLDSRHEYDCIIETVSII